MKTLFCLLALVALATAYAAPQQLFNVNCIMCKVAVKVAENPADKEAHVIENEFDAECKKELGAVPFLDKECEKYANSKLDPIINELEGGTAPDDVCHKLKEC